MHLAQQLTIIKRSDHHDTTLKLSCPTTWNSTLTMIESIADLYNEVQNALKKIGHAELCLHAEEIDYLVLERV